MRWRLIIVVCFPSILWAQQAGNRSSVIAPHGSVGVQVPITQPGPTPNLAIPRNLSVPTEPPNSLQLGTLMEARAIHESWIKELQVKVQSLENTRTYTLGALAGLALAFYIVARVRKLIVRHRSDECR